MESRNCAVAATGSCDTVSKNYAYLSLATLIFIIDRVSKVVALRWCADAACVINRYISFELTFNRGVAWGMFHNAADIPFIIVSLLILLITAVVSWDAYKHYLRNESIIGHVCIIAGSLCNMLDRVIYGGVLDFIILSYKQFSWPVFNVADAAIVCGVFILLFLDEK